MLKFEAKMFDGRAEIKWLRKQDSSPRLGIDTDVPVQFSFDLQALILIRFNF